MPEHRLPLTAFDAIAAGRPDPAALPVLRDTQLSKRLLQLRALRDRLPPSALRLLQSVQDKDPAAWRETLGYPHVGSWLAACLRGEAPPAELNRIAATAAARAGLPGHPPPGPRLSAGAAARAALPARQLISGNFMVYLDDMDPHRAPPGFVAAERLTPAQLAEWQRLVDEAWAILTRWHADRADDIATGVKVLTPLVTAGVDTGVSASCRDQFGAIALTLPGEGIELAVTLVHEWQHSKFNALLDLVDLVQSNADGRYYAPWREDPRPLKALLNGTHAFVGVGSFWHEQWLAGGPHRDRAGYELAHAAAQTGQALRTLSEADGLTPAGRRFVAAMAGTALQWDLGALPARVRELARLATTEHRARWRLNNLTPDPVTISQLAAAWCAGREPVAGAVQPELTPVTDRFAATARASLVTLLATDPDRFANLHPTRYPGLLDPDLLLLRGDLSGAISGYQRLVHADPGHLSAWTGLAVACVLSGESPAWQEHPEVIRALFAHLATRAPAKPPSATRANARPPSATRADARPPSAVELGRWLARADQVGGGSMSVSSRR